MRETFTRYRHRQECEHYSDFTGECGLRIKKNNWFIDTMCSKQTTCKRMRDYDEEINKPINNKRKKKNL